SNHEGTKTRTRKTWLNSLRKEPGMPASILPYMGATPYDGGVTFRVWTPFATAVHVAGTFNGWSLSADALVCEGNDYWSCDVAAARVGDEYKFVLTSPYARAPLWKNDPYARALTQSNGNSVIAPTGDAPTVPSYLTPPWNELVIYEVHVGSFLFDPASPGGRGTFASLISKLDYLRDLGVNAIEIMAAGEFASDHSWGYNQSYMSRTEHLYGAPNGFRNPVAEAHRRGIAVIFDVVYNHIGPSDCDLWQFDGWNQDGHGGIYFYNDWRRPTPWGENRPDYGRGEVRQYLRDNAVRWLEQRACDGLRWDATGYIRTVDGADIPEGWALMEWINREIRQRQPWKVSIAEDMQQNEGLTRPVSGGGAGFTAQWDAGFVHPIRAALTAMDDGARDVDAVAGAI